LLRGPTDEELLKTSKDLQKRANSEFANAKLFKNIDPVRAQKHNQAGLALAIQAANVHARTKANFDFGTNKGLGAIFGAQFAGSPFATKFLTKRFNERIGDLGIGVGGTPFKQDITRIKDLSDILIDNELFQQLGFRPLEQARERDRRQQQIDTLLGLRLRFGGDLGQGVLGQFFVRQGQTSPEDIFNELTKGGFGAGFRTAEQKLGLNTAARQVAITDDNVNRLRNGGTLREGMTVFEAGAVIGGFRHVSDYRDWLRRKRNQMVTSAERSLAGFGTRIGQGGTIAMILASMAQISGDLLRAGLSVPGRGGTVKGNLEILARARRKIKIGEGLLGLDPRFDEDMIKSFTELELHEHHIFYHQTIFELKMFYQIL